MGLESISQSRKANWPGAKTVTFSVTPQVTWKLKQGSTTGSKAGSSPGNAVCDFLE
jgi:hypothetical protein